ncbi:MAG: hypothetical protein V4793_15585, partial [Paraburkholderia tropica]
VADDVKRLGRPVGSREAARVSVSLFYVFPFGNTRAGAEFSGFPIGIRLFLEYYYVNRYESNYSHQII